MVELLLKCDTCTDEKAIAKVSLDLTQIEVQKDPDHTNKIELFADVGVIMKYPTIEILKKLEALTSNNLDEVFNVVVECIDSIYDTEQVYAAKDTSKAELLEFLNNLSSEQFQKIQRFFETMPKLKKEVSYDCPVCNKHHDKVLEGLQSFF
jgi:rubrerythrin